MKNMFRSVLISVAENHFLGTHMFFGATPSSLIRSSAVRVCARFVGIVVQDRIYVGISNDFQIFEGADLFVGMNKNIGEWLAIS